MQVRSLLAGFVEKAQKNGAAYTAFDLMKFIAVVGMTLDHLGAYFFPHHYWIRTLGRITVPVWFFLIGYSRTLSVKRNLWSYAFLLLMNHPFVGRSIFPVNVIVSIIIARLSLNAMLRWKLITAKLPEVLAACVMLILFTDPIFEYGTQAIMIAIFGWMVREGKKEHYTAVFVTSYVSFVSWQIISFQFDVFQSVCIALGCAWVFRWLANPDHTIIWPRWQDSGLKTAVTLVSRNTLPYYFVHRIVFEILSNIVSGKNFGFIIQLFTFQD